MPRTGPSPAEWEQHKAVIETIWIGEDTKLEHLMQEMRDRGFQATSTQYERQLQKWSFSKNLKSEEWIYVSRELKRRLREGKQTQVLFHGRKLDEAKIRKETRRHDLPTLRPGPAIETAPYIRLCTPSDIVVLDAFSLVSVVLPSLDFLRLVDSNSE